MTTFGPGDPATWGPFDGHPNDPRWEDPCDECLDVSQCDDCEHGEKEPSPCDGCPAGKMCATCSENPDNEPDGDPQEERRIEQHSFGVDQL